MTRAISEDKRTFDIRQEFSRAPGEAKNQRASPTRPKGKAGKGKEKERGGKRAENGKGALNSKSYKKGKKKRKKHGPVMLSDEGKGKAWESDQKRRNTHGNTSRKHTWKHTPAKATATATTPCTTHHAPPPARSTETGTWCIHIHPDSSLRIRRDVSMGCRAHSIAVCPPSRLPHHELR